MQKIEYDCAHKPKQGANNDFPFVPEKRKINIAKSYATCRLRMLFIFHLIYKFITPNVDIAHSQPFETQKQATSGKRDCASRELRRSERRIVSPANYI